MKLSDNAVLQRARQFDSQTLAWIYDEYSSAIFAYAYRLTGSAYLAEECVSETFSRLLQALQMGGGPESNLKAYLYRTAHNWITDQFRRQTPLMDGLDDEIEMVADNKILTQAFLEQKDEKNEIRNALRVLTPDQRLVITLRFLEDQTINQVAAALGKPNGAVKSLQHRALQTLKRVLKKSVKGSQDE